MLTESASHVLTEFITGMRATEQAETFRLRVMEALVRRPRGERSIAWLARRVGFRRETVSRAVNRGAFPNVQQAIRETLGLN